MKKITLLLSFARDPWTCPEEPQWAGAACSVFRAFDPELHARPHFLRPGKPHDKYNWWALEMEELTNLEIHIWHGHYNRDDTEKVARMVAASISTLPPILLKALPAGTHVVFDVGSGHGPIYRYYADTKVHAIEFPANWAYPDHDTLDWSFEEILIHEMAHVLDVGLYTIREKNGWNRGSNLDRHEPVTGYSETNEKEMFAEVFTLWIAWRTDHGRPTKQQTLTHEHEGHMTRWMSNRGEFLDKHILDAALTGVPMFAHFGWNNVNNADAEAHCEEK